VITIDLSQRTALVTGAAKGIGAAVAAGANEPNRPRVRLVFACFALKQERPTWPHIEYDFTGDVEQVTEALRRLSPQVEFLPAVVHGPDDATKLLAADKADAIDAYIVYHMNNWVQVMQTIIASGKPSPGGRERRPGPWLPHQAGRRSRR